MKSIFLIAISFLLICCGEYSQKATKSQSYTQDTSLFAHGVASGDPMQDRIILWTHISTLDDNVELIWEMSSSESFEHILHSGKTTTNKDKDHTVKVDVTNLKPGTTYYYRFVRNNRSSIIGRTKTLPDGSASEVNLGIVSCTNYEFGYFNAFNGMMDKNLDAIVHLGDYIYEYGPDTYSDKSFTRKHQPAKEIISLEDYRTRYAQYRKDQGLQKAHQKHPFIMIWDDHEIANNAYKEGAENHQDDEGDYHRRKAIAKQVYFEWQPIRTSSDDVLYRSFQLGNLVDLIMLDERLEGRAEPATDIAEAGAERTMLGAEQLSWLKDQLTTSNAIWKVIGNQVIFAPSDLSIVRPSSPANLDAWDGYAYERDQIRSFLSEAPILNTVFITGDTHCSWAFEIPQINKDYRKDGLSCAVEIGTPSITSSNLNDSGNISDREIIDAEQAIMSTNPHLKFMNGRDHGYTILTLNEDKAEARWYYTTNIKEENAEIYLAKKTTILRDVMKLEMSQ